jgi:predicted aspartyl protease
MDSPLPGDPSVLSTAFSSVFSVSSVAVKDIVIEEGSMDRKHLVITCFLSHSDQEIQTYALIDCGATGYAFIDEDFAHHQQYPLCPLKNPHTLEVIDGHRISSGDITHIAEVQLSIQEHYKKLPIFITKLGHYPIVLGIPWLKQYNIAIRFTSNLVTFGSQYCLVYCNDRAVTVRGTSKDPPEPLAINAAPLSITMIRPVPLTRQAKHN